MNEIFKAEDGEKIISSQSFNYDCTVVVVITTDKRVVTVKECA